MSKSRGYAMKMVVDGKEREISFEELTLSNKLSHDALISLLIKKQLIEPQEMLDEIALVKKERFRSEADLKG
ncbi:MAG: hypothetical protein ABIJ61_03265 [bacterium]